MGKVLCLVKKKMINIIFFVPLDDNNNFETLFETIPIYASFTFDRFPARFRNVSVQFSLSTSYIFFSRHGSRRLESWEVFLGVKSANGKVWDRWRIEKSGQLFRGLRGRSSVRLRWKCGGGLNEFDFFIIHCSWIFTNVTILISNMETNIEVVPVDEAKNLKVTKDPVFGCLD